MSPPEEPGRRRVDPRFRRRWGLAIVVLGALAVYGAFLEGGPSELDLVAGSNGSDGTELHATGDAEDAEDASASPEPGFGAITFAGTGRARLEPRIPGDQPAILNITHSGTAAFVVEAGDGQGVSDILVETSGSYAGTRPANLGPASRAFDIRAEGTWAIEILPLSSAPRVRDGRASGRGDQVLLVDGGGSGWFSHTGRASVTVEEYGGSPASPGASVVDGVGPHDGAITVSDGTEALVITADGAWEVLID